MVLRREDGEVNGSVVVSPHPAHEFLLFAAWLSRHQGGVGSFQELVSNPFADGFNAQCWERALP